MCLLQANLCCFIMGKNSDISSHIVAQIVALRNEGLTQVTISTRLKVSQSIVSRALKRHRETGQYGARKRTGRGRCTSTRTDTLIKRIATVTPTATSSFIQSQLPQEGLPSTRTINRRLTDDHKLKAYRPAAKPKLSAKNVKDRIAFCKRYRSWSVEQWKKVMFSDETTVKQFDNYTQLVRRPVGKRYSARYVVPKVKHSPSVMVWGCISAHGRGGLWFLPENESMNSANYLQVVQEKLPVWMPRLSCTIFQQDGAPAHTSKAVKAWFRANEYQVLEGWPGNSPDLNVIENCWTTVKKKVANANPTSLKDLIDKIRRVWVQEITDTYCRELVESMPRRIEAVLTAKGHHTKY